MHNDNRYNLIIRAVTKEDYPAFHAIHRMPGVRENTLAWPAMRLERTVERNDARIDLMHMLVAEVDGIDDEKGKRIIAGEASVCLKPSPRHRHVGWLGIMVHTAWQGSGIGKKLMSAILDLADNWLMLVRVELTVFASNIRAIEMYESFGFETEARMRMGAVRFGAYEDELMMARIRNRGE